MFSDIILESILLNNNNLHINTDRWTDGSNNVLYITGHSGSGKSTLAENTSKAANAIVIGLDTFEHNHYIQKSTKLGDLLVLKYLKSSGNQKKLDKILALDDTIKKYDLFMNEFNKFFNWLVNCVESDKRNRYVIEGIQIIFYVSPEFFNNRSLILTGASMITSIYQRFIMRKDPLTISSLPEIFSFYKTNEKLINIFKNEVKG